MRYEEIILGQNRCKEDPQVVPAWFLGLFFVQRGMFELKVEKNDLGFDSLQRAIRYWP